MTYMIIPYLGFGTLTGITASLFGLGGGLIVVPTLLWLLPSEGIPHEIVMHAAIATSLAVMILNSLNSTYHHAIRGNILWKKVYTLSPCIAVGSMIGVWSSGFLSHPIMKTCFVLFMGYTIFKTLLSKHFIYASSEKKLVKPSILTTYLLGMTIGFIATTLGIGGSVMTVPLLRRWNAKMVQATATANPLSIPIALVGSLGNLVFLHNDAPLPHFLGWIYLPAFLGIAIGGFLGVPLGVKISKFIPDQAFAKMYMALLILALLAVLAH